jgi:3-isopropylmalate/(R)-2-methylmalate dehydratase small subunit
VVDLEHRVLRAGGHEWPFAVEPRARWLLMNGLDDIAVTIERAAAIDAYEERRRRWLPSIRRGDLVGGPYPEPAR